MAEILLDGGNAIILGLKHFKYPHFSEYIRFCDFSSKLRPLNGISGASKMGALLIKSFKDPKNVIKFQSSPVYHRLLQYMHRNLNGRYFKNGA